MRPSMWFAASVVCAAIVAGAAAGAIGLVDVAPDAPTAAGQPATELPPGEAAYSLCPDSARLGLLHGGDRVLVTGVDPSGDWVEVRAPEDLAARVWVRRQDVDPDRSLDELPVADCAFTAPTTSPPSTAGGVEPPATTGPPTTGPPDTGPAVPPTSTFPSTTGPPTSPSTPPAPTSTLPSTTGAPDTTPPVISGLTVSVPRIWESGPSCTRLPQQATVTVNVSDEASAVSTVTLAWSVGDTDGSSTMARAGSSWSATVGPFPPGTVDASGDAVVLTVTATDAAGNSSNLDDHRLLRLEGCEP